jgi:DNA-directed RNA polymerase specialized sigma24 family protein
MVEIRQVHLCVDASDYDDFYRDAEPRIRRALTALGPTAAQDATAAAMAYGFEHWDRVQGMDNPVGYLYRVGRNSIRDRRKPMPVDVPVGAAENGFEPGLPKALNALSERQRAAVLLVHAWGYPLSEAAQVLGLSVSSLRNHLGRGLTRLRRNIGVQQ